MQAYNKGKVLHYMNSNIAITIHYISKRYFILSFKY